MRTLKTSEAAAVLNVSPNTLRAWERRYGIIEPARGEGGQRGYSQDDLEVIREMVELTRSGVAPAAAAETVRTKRKAGRPGERRFETWRQRFRKAVESMRPASVLDVCREAEKSLGYRLAVEKVLFPEMNRLGEKWHTVAGTVAEEHCATLGVRTWLSDRYLRPETRKRAIPVVVLACIPGELHDLPLLHLANLLADSEAAFPLTLAAGLPLAETLNSAQRTGARLLLLSGTMPVSSGELRQWATEIRESGWEQKCILAGSTFRNSRIFSETRLRAAAGSYEQSVDLILDIIAP